MKDRNSLKLNVLTVLVVIILAALAAQSVALYRISGLNQAGKEDAETESVTKSSSEAAQSTPAPLPDRNAFFDDPLFEFDMNDWDPFREMQSMNERIDRMFGSAFNRFRNSDGFSDLFEKHGFSPDLNIEESDDKYVVTMDLPGADASSVKIDLEGRTLTVSGSSDRSNRAEKEGRVIMQERRSGKFRRSVELPGPVKADELESSTENGVLRIIIPKENELQE